MMAVAHFGLPFSYTLAARTAQVLANVEVRCRAVTTAPEVRSVFAAGLGELRTALAQPPDDLGAEPDRAACSRLAKGMGLDQGETFPRVLYALQEKARSLALAPKASNKISLKMLEEDSSAEQIRLPMQTGGVIDGIAFWHKVIMDFASVKRPLLYLHPLANPWVDVIIGTPTARQLYAIRANEAALPLASAVPYDLDPAFRSTAAGFIDKLCDLTPQPPLFPESKIATPPQLPS